MGSGGFNQDLCLAQWYTYNINYTTSTVVRRPHSHTLADIHGVHLLCGREKGKYLWEAIGASAAVKEAKVQFEFAL